MKPRIPEVVRVPTTFHRGKDHVVAVSEIATAIPGYEHVTLGIRFKTPEDILRFMAGLMEKAVEVWPDNKWIQEYLSD